MDLHTFTFSVPALLLRVGIESSPMLDCAVSVLNDWDVDCCAFIINNHTNCHFVFFAELSWKVHSPRALDEDAVGTLCELLQCGAST